MCTLCCGPCSRESYLSKFCASFSACLRSYGTRPTTWLQNAGSDFKRTVHVRNCAQGPHRGTANYVLIQVWPTKLVCNWVLKTDWLVFSKWNMPPSPTVAKQWSGLHVSTKPHFSFPLLFEKIMHPFFFCWKDQVVSTKSIRNAITFLLSNE